MAKKNIIPAAQWSQKGLPSAPLAPVKQHSAEEQKLIDFLEKEEGRKLTPQEINLAIDQAKSVGDL
jgi:hypothetical protein